MIRPVCVKDEKEYKVNECGFALVEMVEREGGEVPYAIYFGDLWECPVCGHQIIGGYGLAAAREHEKDRFQHLIETYKDLGKIQFVR